MLYFSCHTELLHLTEHLRGKRESGQKNNNINATLWSDSCVKSPPVSLQSLPGTCRPERKQMTSFLIQTNTSTAHAFHVHVCSTNHVVSHMYDLFLLPEHLYRTGPIPEGKQSKCKGRCTNLMFRCFSFELYSSSSGRCLLCGTRSAQVHQGVRG
jgi:hypothetical protein